MKKMLMLLALVCSVASLSAAADAVRLPAPDKSGGMSLAQALSERRSSREFDDVAISPQDMSDLIWSVAGVNRVGGKRVFPVGLGRQDMTAYVFTRDGAYRYDAEEHALIPVVSGDHRAATGTQPFVAAAAVNIAFVQDMGMWSKDDKDKATGEKFGNAHAGGMMENGYLFAAARGWSAVIRGSFREPELKKLLGLGDSMHIRLILSIGPGR